MITAVTAREGVNFTTNAHETAEKYNSFSCRQNFLTTKM